MSRRGKVPVPRKKKTQVRSRVTVLFYRDDCDSYFYSSKSLFLMKNTVVHRVGFDLKKHIPRWLKRMALLVSFNTMLHCSLKCPLMQLNQYCVLLLCVLRQILRLSF